MIINEQSKKSREDLLKDNWIDVKPKDYNGTDYFPSKLGADGRRYYKRRDGKPIDIDAVGAQTPEGTYTTNMPKIKKVEVYKRKDENGEDSLFLTSIFLKSIPKLEDYSIAKLTPKDSSSTLFSISSNGVELPDAEIRFTNDGFTFKYKPIAQLNRFTTITGTKEKGTASEPTDKKDNKKKTDPVTSTTTTQDDKKSDIPVVKSKPLYFNNDQKDTTPKKSCNDFPFTLGCVNTKIGDLNAKFFRGNRYDDMYNKQLENVLDNNGYFSNSKNELTKAVWDYLMNKSIMKESIKKVLKEYINKKK
jgi:hypothetical protein